ncbi:MAG: hypothetical protein NVSMB43_16490 [Pseudarthrobacter sp.]
MAEVTRVRAPTVSMATGSLANRPSGMKLRPARSGSLAKRPAGGGVAAVGLAEAAVLTGTVGEPAVTRVPADSAGADTEDRGVGFKIPGSFSHAHRPSSRRA